MNQLLQFATHHPTQVAMLVLTAIAVLVYELRLRTHSSGSISPQDAVRLMNQGAAVLDVRSADAWAAGHIGNARALPPGGLTAAADALKRFRDKPVIVYCDRGNSSVAAVRELTRLGFTKPVSLRGGLGAWRSENLPVVRQSGAGQSAGGQSPAGQGGGAVSSGGKNSAQ
jgi:rhodanese-related sulfurtransferase